MAAENLNIQTFLPPNPEAVSAAEDDPAKSGLRAWLGKIGSTFAAIRTDYDDSEHKAQTVSSGVLALGTQGAGLSKLSFIVGPAATMSVLEATNSAPATGAIVGAGFGAWTYVVAKVLNNSTKKFPATYEEAGRNFPSLVKFASDSLPGFELRPDDHASSIRGVARSAISHFSRGWTAATLTTAGYVVTAGMQGRSESYMSRLTRTLGMDTGVVAGILSGGAAEAIVSLAHDHPETAQVIQDNVGNHYLGMGLAIGMIGLQRLKTKTGT